MKDKIINKLNDYAEYLMDKETLTFEEVNFLIYWMQRIECKEQQEADKVDREQNNARWKESMMAILDRGMGGV